MRLQVGKPSPLPCVKSWISANGLNSFPFISVGMPVPVSVMINCPVCALLFLNSNVIFRYLCIVQHFSINKARCVPALLHLS